MNTPENAASGGTVVTFVEPDGMSAHSVRKLGSWQMPVPPRHGETVTMQPVMSADFCRYRVAEVVHHLPPRSLENISANAVTIILVRHHSTAEVDAVAAAIVRDSAGMANYHYHRDNEQGPDPAA